MALRPHLRLIALVGLIVPRRLRADWRQEWETELRHREMLLADWDRLGWRSTLDLFRRSSSAFWDALWLQKKRLEADVLQDLRYGVRMLLTHPGFTAVAVLTLPLGIGANTAIFTLLDRLVLRRLPVERPDQLATFANDISGTSAIYSYPEYVNLRDRNTGLSGQTDRIQDLALPLKLLMGVVGFVLVIACANVANLLLARASSYLPARRAVRVDPIAVLTNS